MLRRTFLASTVSAWAAPPRRPNFVFLFSDDHHFQCLGAAGNPHIHTPNLDRLASRGLLFTNAQISTAQCAPSRGVLLSGLETVQNGLISNGQTSFRPNVGPAAIEQLRRAGYQTTLVGKWHISHPPAACGFADAPLWLRAGGSVYLNPKLCRGLDGQPRETPGHITDLFTDAAIEAIGAAKSPFFLWLSYNAPHTPWFAEDRYRRPYAGKESAGIAPPSRPPGGAPFDWITYYSVITHLDEAIGRLLTSLEQRGLWESTNIVFLGDNGMMNGTRNLTGKVVPWEESVRVPLIAAGAGVVRGAVTDAPAASIDLTATWLEQAGVKPARPLAGRPLTKLMRTGKGGPEAGFSVWDDGRPEGLATRKPVEPYRLVRTRTHKLIVWESRRQALFDLRADFAEQHNLLDTSSGEKLAAPLRRLLARRLQSTGDRAAAWMV